MTWRRRTGSGFDSPTGPESSRLPYRGILRIGSTTIADIPITELGDEAIIGMQVMASFTLTIDHGRTLTLRP
jgi:hypothetical protein